MKQSTWWMFGGIVSLIGGVVALAYPLASTLVATMLAAWAFLIGGIASLIASFRLAGMADKIAGVIWSLIAVALGIYIVMNPAAGMLSLTFATGILILMLGIIRIVAGWRLRKAGPGWLAIVAGIVGVLIGLAMLKYLPVMATVALGTFLGVDLIFNGIAQIAIASSVKSLTGRFEDRPSH